MSEIERDGLWAEGSAGYMSVITADQEGYKLGWWERGVIDTLTSRRNDLWNDAVSMEHYFPDARLVIPMEVL